MPLDVFEKDLAQLSKITNGKIEDLIIGGGEPLLNKDIEEYIKLARKYFKKSCLMIKTNALILNTMEDDFYKTCIQYDVSIQHNVYPLYKAFPNLKTAYEKALKYNVKMIVHRPKYLIQQNLLNKKSLQNSKINFNTCKNKTITSILNNGKLYPCQIMAGVDLFFNKYFKDQAFEINKNDYLDIFKISSLEEILEFYKKPKDFCEHCGGFDLSRGKKNIWKLSNKDISEWYDINS